MTTWNASRSGKRAGKRVGFPRFKSKRGRWSFRVSTGAFGLAKQDRRHVQLPRIGIVRTHESTRKLRRLQRKASCRTGPDKPTGQHPSNRWRKTQRQVSTLHTQVSNARRDGLHQLSTRLVDEFDAIAVEDLNVAGMVRNRRLARHIADAGMVELRRRLDYKLAGRGGRWSPQAGSTRPVKRVWTAAQ